MKNPPLHGVESVGPNMTEVRHGDLTILYSYKIPVLFYDRAYGGFFLTDERGNSTTSRHMKRYLKLWGEDDASIKKMRRLPQGDINTAVQDGQFWASGRNPGHLARGRADAGPRPGPYGGSPGRTPRYGARHLPPPVGGSPGRTPNPGYPGPGKTYFTDGDVGCYIDGAHGMEHAVHRMRELLSEVAGAFAVFPVGNAARELLVEEDEGLSEDDWDEWLQDATDDVLSHDSVTPDHLIWDWEAGDLCLRRHRS